MPIRSPHTYLPWYTMELLERILTILEVVPTVLVLTIIWTIIAFVFYKFKGGLTRTILLSVLFTAATWCMSKDGEWFPGLVSYGLLGCAAVLTRAMYGPSPPLCPTQPDADPEPRAEDNTLWLLPLLALWAFTVVQSYPALTALVSHTRNAMLKGISEENVLHGILSK